MSTNRENRSKDIIAALFITIIFICIISVIFVQLSNQTYEIKHIAEITNTVVEISKKIDEMDYNDFESTGEKSIKELEEFKDTKIPEDVEIKYSVTENEEEKIKEIKLIANFQEDKTEITISKKAITEKVKEEKKYSYTKPEISEEYVPIKFIWTGDHNGYWIKTTENDKEWYSIEEGIYPTYAYNPEITRMTFLINGNYNNYDVITNWNYNFYIWIPKIEDKEYDSALFLKQEKGTLLQYDNGWENEFNKAYNQKQKIDILPDGAKEKIQSAYQTYVSSMRN